MKQLIHLLVFFVLVFTSSNTYCMEEVMPSTVSLQDLPPELVEAILDELTVDITADRYMLYFSEQEADAIGKALRRLYGIRRILPFNSVCRRLHVIVSHRIRKYFLDAETHINQVEGADAILSRAVRNGNSEIAQLCLMIDADINATQYTANNIIVPRYAGAETLLTEAIKRGNHALVQLLLRLGADPMRSNTQGEVPIDVARSRGFYQLAAILKENGGDPNNHYWYYCSDRVSSTMGYSSRIFEPQDRPTNPFMVEEPQQFDDEALPIPCIANNETKKYAFAFSPICRRGVVFSAGALVGSVGYWAYKKWQKHKRAKQKRRQELWDEYHRQRVFAIEVPSL